MRLLLDMNLTPRWVGFLQAAGHETTHWSAVGALDAPDNVLMAWAHEHSAVLLTADLDFSAILAASRGTGPSVVQVRDAVPVPETVGASLLGALERMALQLQAGAIVTLDARRARVRILPLET